MGKEKEKNVVTGEDLESKRVLKIPVNKIIPVNGRIFVISVTGEDLKTKGGLILPPKFGTKKNDQVEGVKRYFVIDWDKKGGIPKEICDLLRVGIEVHPFLPQNAEEFQLPRIVDWNANDIYDVLHYTELGGIGMIEPEVVDE